ncbi:MAG TPA: dihydrolipoamide acetyltransferase family protein [Chloroflexota bacterium]|nr:dihydrolipoamide acetyltransferase family protein [Chloroflexota bacterium]
MAVEVVMPRLGWTMETASVAEWLKHDGDAVREGDILFTVETDKVAQEVEALDSGILRIPPSSAPPGVSVPVGTVLAYVTRPGEAAPFEGRAAPSVPASQPAQVATSAGPATAGANGLSTAPASPRARRVARELGVDWTTIAGSGSTGRIVERDVRAAATAQPAAARARVSPVARRVAQQQGVDLDELAAQMPDKRITRADIDAAVRPPADHAPESGHSRPLSRTRRVIGERMVHSAHTTAPVTLTTEADATELAALRGRIKRSLAGSNRQAPSYTDLLARLTALALLEHPWMNSTLTGETIVQHEAVHMGIAVDTERGLLVPVVRDAHLKSIQRIAEESKELIAAARAGTSTPDQLGGSTFSLTNLGMYEIDAFTPIINLPECAILGVGRIVARQVVIDEETEELAVRKMLALSLTFDHRVVDGGPAARFLQRIKRSIEQPYTWLIA